MEEVDNIIIDALRNLHCDVEEDLTGLGEFTADMVFTSIVCCLEAITPGLKLSNKLPHSMSLRLKVATHIAELISNLGYRADMGYQTILYCNETEIRRVLMFLVERLPRETNKSTASEELGYVSMLVKKIEQRIRMGLEKPWVPTCFLRDGMRDCGEIDLKQNFSYGYPLQTESIRIPGLEDDYSEALKQFWVHNLQDVTKQCSSQNLIPSLLYHDSKFLLNQIKVDEVQENTGLIKEINVLLETNLEQQNATENSIEIKMKNLIQDVNVVKSNYEQLRSKRQLLEAKSAETIQRKTEKEANLKENLLKIKTKSKTLAVASNEDNKLKLKQLINSGSKRLADLSNQWKQVQMPILEEYHELQQNHNEKESKIHDVQQKLRGIKEKNSQLQMELKEKELLEQQLIKDVEKLNKNTNRSSYTKRILEIIGNVKKQTEEIHKILQDTKTVQKEINNLNGQLDRSFTLSDELIFRDAKRNEMARKAYKLLATLHKDAGEVVQAVTDLGLSERECRNLQEQVDIELARETSSKLDRVNADLAEIQIESALLIKQIKEHSS